MKILFGMALTMSAAIAQPALAGPWREYRGGLVQVQMQRERPDRFQRQPQRDLRRAETAPERGPRGDGRLTEEERRELHRDLDRANREIYKGRQR